MTRNIQSLPKKGYLKFDWNGLSSNVGTFFVDGIGLHAYGLSSSTFSWFNGWMGGAASMYLRHHLISFFSKSRVCDWVIYTSSGNLKFLATTKSRLLTKNKSVPYKESS